MEIPEDLPEITTFFGSHKIICESPRKRTAASILNVIETESKHEFLKGAGRASIGSAGRSGSNASSVKSTKEIGEEENLNLKVKKPLIVELD